MALNDAFTQVVIVGLIAFCCPGLFNALSGLGAAGSNDPKYANQANCALYACFAVFGYFGGVFFNMFGNKWLMAGGGLTYAIYALCMYISGNVSGAEWVAVLGGVILGLGAGLFWTAQGAMMMSYSTVANKGNYIGWFWIIFNLGGLLGGLLQFAINYNNTDGDNKANAASYFTFIALMTAGSLAVPFLLKSPGEVVKADNTAVQFERGADWKEEVTGAVKASLETPMLLLAVFFAASNFFTTYQFNFVNGHLFNVRTRGLNSAFYWGAQMLAAWLIGIVLDYPAWTRRQRAVAGWVFSFVSFAVAWALGTYVQHGFEGGYDKDRPMMNPIDFKESSRAFWPTLTFVLYGLADAALQAFAYWIMGAIAGRDFGQAARYAGFYKGIQSLGAAIAWGIDLNKSCTYAIQFWIGFGLWALGSLLAFFVVRNLTNEDEVTVPTATQLQRSSSQGPMGQAVEGIKRSTSLAQQHAVKSDPSLAATDSALAPNVQSAPDGVLPVNSTGSIEVQATP